MDQPKESRPLTVRLETSLQTVLLNAREYAVFNLREQTEKDMCDVWNSNLK